ncbi:response regulator transcription factor [Paraburkholderia sp. SIMBA_050]|uniref:Two component transcriptional regulator, LuxR family n=1 Tax=Paraburkholderia terricola TaxID=169427 RepID=A0A1M6VHG5_9BURK|nr:MULTISPECIES: response regulator transcription factor [Paraburkholderia]SDP06269.1 two component transcriptional regulator, LuxR family [Paraburkholderia sediminicola]SHK80784.1 two component transcriptional regulator, LuxR family [Paraburkholderia terricola]
MSTMKIRVVLADDHPALLSGIKHALSVLPTLDVVGTAGDSGERIRLLNAVPCDVVITDYAMPGGEYGDGMTLLAYLRRTYPALKIVVFTTIENPAIAQEIANLGVHGVLGKSHDTGHVISAIHAVYAGATYFRLTSRAPEGAHAELASNASARTRTLTTREMEVVRLFVSGMSVNEIAERLHRTKQTISSQKTRAMRKLGIDRDADLFRFAYETGLAVATDAPGTSSAGNLAIE